MMMTTLETLLASALGCAVLGGATFASVSAEAAHASASRQDAVSRVLPVRHGFVRLGYPEAASKASRAAERVSSAKVYVCGGWQPSRAGGSFKACEWK